GKLGITPINNFFNKIINIFPAFEEEVCKISTEFYKCVETFPHFYAKEVLDYMPKLINSLKSILPEEEGFIDNAENKSTNNDFGKVLYVDNNIQFGKKVQVSLAKHGITCELAFDVVEAINIIKEDCSNRITTLVSDNRFFNRDKRFNRKQSYHISKALADLPNQVNVITLCGLSTRKLTSLPLQHRRMIVPMLKNDIFKNALGMENFCHTIKQLNREALFKIEQPSMFKDAHLSLYKLHRESYDYELIESDISQTAFTFVKEIAKNGFIPKYLLPAINGRLRTKNQERDLQNFRDILLARRFILGLCQLPYKVILRFEQERNKNIKFDRKDLWFLMYNALKNGELKLNLDEIDDPELNTAFNRSLRMSIRKNYNWQISKNYSLTIEEKNWLRIHCEYFANSFEE
ncbi:MAG: hypothetical protein AAGI07_15745, partial [Bacteroidota bacterium]